MSETEPVLGGGEEHDTEELWGEVPDFGIDLGLRPPVPDPTLVDQLTADTAPLRGQTITTVRDGLLKDMHFRERYAKSRIESDLIGLVRHLPEGKVERYSDKLAREAAKGKSESASFGLGKINDHDVVVYAMNWDFYAGSMGVVAGDKFQKAADLARQKNLPLISVFSSSGVRQQENYAGLLQMPRDLFIQADSKKNSKQPHVSILLGQVWGGVSASIAPMSDLVIGVPGTEYGFSGPNVIEAYEGKTVERGAQRVESHLAYRNVDAIVEQGKILSYLGDLLDTMQTDRHTKIVAEDVQDGAIESGTSPGTGVDFNKPRIYSVHTRALTNVTDLSRGPSWKDGKPTPEELYDRYERLVRDPMHPDAEFFMRNSFTDSVPFYNSYVAERKLQYPAIIASIGRIGVQPFLVLGSQASYQQTFDGMRRVPSSPAPADFEYIMRMLDLGERWKLPAVFLADTLGAKPTLETERNNQMRKIAETIMRGITYREPVITVVTGALGSGGGLAVAPNADHFAMLETSLAFVAEPRSCTSILYRTAEPSKQQVMQTLSTMSATAADQQRLGLSDETIAESTDPYQTARNVRNAIARATLGLQELSSRQLQGRRERRIRSTEKGLRINHSH